MRPLDPVRTAVLALLALLASSSPISAEDSPPEEPEVPEEASVHEKSDVTVPEPARVRELVRKGQFEEALEEVRRLGAVESDSATISGAQLLEARLLDRLGQPFGAVRAYRRALGDPIVGERARAELHELYVRRGEFDAADRLTAAVADGDPESRPADVRRRAHSMTVQGEFEAAAALVADLARAGDGHAGVLRANALLALERRDEAESLFLAVLDGERAPSVRQVAHFGLGQVARLQGGRAVRAIQDEKAVALGSAPWAELDWGLALRALGRREEARAHLQAAAAGDRALGATTHLALARLHEEEGRASEAVESLVQSLEGSTGDFLAWTRLGDLLLQEGEEEEGIRAYRSALVLFPDLPPTLERLSRALAARGRWEEAPSPDRAESEWRLPGWTWERLLDGDLPFYEMAADRASIPLEDPRRVVLALVQLRSGFPAGALGWAEPGGGPLLESLRAEALEAVGRTEEAVQAWEAQLETGPGSPIARERLARLVYAEDPEAAARHWHALFEAHPGWPRARMRQAERLEAAGDREGALAAYQAAAGQGWLSPAERQRIRRAVDDLEAEIQEESEEDLEAEETG